MRHARTPKKARGYAIFELTIVTCLITSAIVFSLKYYKYQYELDRAQILAKIYQNLNAAIGTYMTVYYFELRQLDKTCSTLALGEGSAPSAVDFSICGLDIPMLDDQLNQLTTKPPVKIANALQPTVAELVSLGLLHKETSEIPPFAHRNTVRNSSGLFEPFRFAFLIEHACVGATRMPSANSLPSCLNNNQDLRTYVFNTQPYFGPHASDADKQLSWLGEVAVKAGADAAMTTSLTPLPGELYGHKGAWQLDNPLRNVSTGRGMTHMVVMVNGYGSSGLLQLTRRDGSMWPTDHWNFNQKDITNIRRLEVTDRMKIPKKTLGTSCDFATESTAFDDAARALMICDKDPADPLKATWLHTRGKGAANWDDYIDVTLMARPNSSSRNSGVDTLVTFASAKGPLDKMNYSQLPSPSNWTAATFSYELEGLDAALYGMPIIMENTALDYRQEIRDDWCPAHMGGGIFGVLGGTLVVTGVFGGGLSLGGPVPYLGVLSATMIGAAGLGTGPVIGAAAGPVATGCVYPDQKQNWWPTAQNPEFKLAVNPTTKKWQLYTDMRYGGQLTVRFHKLYQ
jgi:hypothetical protein